MKLTSCLLCHSALVRDGLISILGGGITQLYREEFPASPSFTVAMVIELTESELGKDHQVAASIRREDRKPVAELSGSFFSQSTVALNGKSLVVPFAVPFPQVPALPEAGEYELVVRLNGRTVRKLPFTVVKGRRGEQGPPSRGRRSDESV